jgi:hypothetical protein
LKIGKKPNGFAFAEYLIGIVLDFKVLEYDLKLFLELTD